MIAVVALAALLIAFGPSHDHQQLGNTLIVESQSAPDHLDTALSYTITSWEIEINADDGLLTYRKTAGATGAQLVPDLATAMPTVSSDGLTWTFHMRRGIEWGPPLTRDAAPTDIKWAIERVFLMSSPGSGFYTDIVGADAYEHHKASSITGIDADDSAYTISFHLTKPNPVMGYLLALPFAFAVPHEIGATETGQGGDFVPALGPYMFTKYVPNELIQLRRNPHFHQWSPSTPAGKVDGIDVNLGQDPENSVTMIKQGQADFMMDQIPRSKMAVLLSDRSLADQIKVSPTAKTFYMFLNTAIPPFNNVKVRLALNWAIDRRAMAKLNGGTIVPSETILPPAMPGYRDHHLYARPDMAKAKALMAQSGIARGMRVDFWCKTTDTDEATAQYMQGVLDQLGFNAQTKCIDASGYRDKMGNQDTRAQIGTDTWSEDYPEASDFIDVLLNGERIVPRNSNNESWFNEPTINKEIDAADAEPVQRQRNQMWAKLDAEIMEQAPWAPYGYASNYSFISKRFHNYVFNPVYYTLLDQAVLTQSRRWKRTARRWLVTAGVGTADLVLPIQLAPDAPSTGGESRVAESPMQIAIQRLKRDRVAQVAAACFLALVLACACSGIIGKEFAGRSYAEANLSGFVDRGGHRIEVVDIHGVPRVGPGLHRQYLLGSDELGRDVFVRVLRGGTVSLEVGFGAALVTTVFAIIFGILAGYHGGRWDTVISRYFDIQWAFPQTILAIALSSALASGGGFLFFQRGSLALPIGIIGVVSIPYLGRPIRSQALVIAKREFVEASHALGSSHLRTMVTQVLPNVITLVISYFALLVGLDIIQESLLSFLGVGVLPPTPSWGNIMSDGKAFYSTAWWISLVPGIAIGITVLTLNLMAQSLEEALSPKGVGDG